MPALIYSLYTSPFPLSTSLPLPYCVVVVVGHSGFEHLFFVHASLHHVGFGLPPVLSHSTVVHTQYCMQSGCRNRSSGSQLSLRTSTSAALALHCTALHRQSASADRVEEIGFDPPCRSYSTSPGVHYSPTPPPSMLGF